MNKSNIKLFFISILCVLTLSCTFLSQNTGNISFELPATDDSRAAGDNKISYQITLKNQKGNIVFQNLDAPNKVEIKDLQVGKYFLHVSGKSSGIAYFLPEGKDIPVDIKAGEVTPVDLELVGQILSQVNISLKDPGYIEYGSTLNASKISIKETYGSVTFDGDISDYQISPQLGEQLEIGTTQLNFRHNVVNTVTTLNVDCKYHIEKPEVTVKITAGTADVDKNSKDTKLTAEATFTDTKLSPQYNPVSYQWQSKKSGGTYSNVIGANTAELTVPTTEVGTVTYNCVVTVTPKNQTFCLDKNRTASAEKGVVITVKKPTLKSFTVTLKPDAYIEYGKDIAIDKFTITETYSDGSKATVKSGYDGYTVSSTKNANVGTGNTVTISNGLLKTTVSSVPCKYNFEEPEVSISAPYGTEIAQYTGITKLTAEVKFSQLADQYNLTYQWTKDGESINANTKEITADNVKSGTYKCNVSVCPRESLNCIQGNVSKVISSSEIKVNVCEWVLSLHAAANLPTKLTPNTPYKLDLTNSKDFAPDNIQWKTIGQNADEFSVQQSKFTAPKAGQNDKTATIQALLDENILASIDVCVPGSGITTFDELKAAINRGDSIITIGDNITLSPTGLTITKPVTIQSAPGNKFTLTRGIKGDLLTINGTGIEVTFKNLIIDGNNVAATAPAIFISNAGIVNLDNCKITKNISDSDGGAILANAKTALNLKNGTIIEGNQAANGGGIKLNNGTLTLGADCKIQNNTATGSGQNLLLGTLNGTYNGFTGESKAFDESLPAVGGGGAENAFTKFKNAIETGSESIVNITEPINVTGPITISRDVTINATGTGKLIRDASYGGTSAGDNGQFFNITTGNVTFNKVTLDGGYGYSNKLHGQRSLCIITGGNVNFNGCTLMNNYVDNDGGGAILINNSAAVVSIQGFNDGSGTILSTIKNNEIYQNLNGAAIYVISGKLNVKQCNFSSNKHNNSTTRSISIGNGAYFNNTQNNSGTIETYSDKNYE